MNTIRRLTLLLIAALLIACDDDATGHARELSLAAEGFEQLGRERAAVGDGSGGIVSLEAAHALRAGARPTPVSITIDGAAERYWALAVERAFDGDATESPESQLPLVSRTLIAWRGSPPERVVAVAILADTGTLGTLETLELDPGRPWFYTASPTGIMFERGGSSWTAIEGGARSTRQKIGARCPLPRTGGLSSLAPVVAPTTCKAAVFLTRFSMRVDETGASRVGRVIEMGGHETSGIVLRYPSLPTLCAVRQ